MAWRTQTHHADRTLDHHEHSSLLSSTSPTEPRAHAPDGTLPGGWLGCPHRGVAKRSVFVVDGNNRTRYRWVTDDALVEPDFEGAIAVIESLDDDSAAPESRVDTERRRARRS
jgi:hypothetical protein